MATPSLGIELSLERAGGIFCEKYRLMKDRLLNVEYEHWAAGFPEGNNHGRGHITRVLENLDHLLGPDPLKHLFGPYELFLAMMAILYHDIGLLHERKGHEEISKTLLEGDTNDAYIINNIDKELIAAAVVSHSSSKDIAHECGRFSPEEIIGVHRVRPAVIAALVRLADELDEDYRRADPILQRRLRLPPESDFFWRFCQRVRGVRPNLAAKRIDFNLALEAEDTMTVSPIPGGKVRHFVAFCAEKLAKINAERVKVNAHLPMELQFGGVHVDVKPLPKHPVWRNPRTFVFNDHTPADMFIRSFPELLDEPVKAAMHGVLDAMKQGQLDEADRVLDLLGSIQSDLPVEVQMQILYAKACTRSMRAAMTPAASQEKEQLLDESARLLSDWFRHGQSGSFKKMGRTAAAEVGRMVADGDLKTVRSQRVVELRKSIPAEHWPRAGGGGGGCVPKGTLVDTPRGARRIEQLSVGDGVVSLRLGGSIYRVISRIQSVHASAAPHCVQLNGKWMVTPTQPVRSTAGWVEAGTLALGDHVMDGRGELVPITELTTVEGEFEVYDLSLNDPDHNYIASGLLCHNKVQYP